MLPLRHSYPYKYKNITLINFFLIFISLLNSWRKQVTNMCFIRVLFPHPCFNPSSVFYPLIRILFSYPCCIPSFVFYPFFGVLHPHLSFIPSSIRVVSPYPRFILHSCFITYPCYIRSSVFNPLIRVLSPYPWFIPLSAFYPPICVLSLHPYPRHPYPCHPYLCFIPILFLHTPYA